MLLPDPTGCLKHLLPQLARDGRARPGDACLGRGEARPLRRAEATAPSENVPTPGRFYFTQTFQLHRSRFLELVKPLLAYLTTIDFGQVTYAALFFARLEEAGLKVDLEEVISTHGGRSARMVVASR